MPSAEIHAGAAGRWRYWSRLLLPPIAIALLAAGFVLVRGNARAVSDFDQLWIGARALLRGADPYSVVGPNREFSWDYLYYPLPAVLLVSPLAVLPLLAARAVFAAISAGVLAAALMRESPVRLLMFLSAPTLVALGRGQFGPLILASAFLPWLAWVGVGKPNIGAAVFPASRQPRTTIIAGLVGGGLLLVASFLIFPGWLTSWREALSHKGDNMPVLVRTGGVVILLALARWRRRESWLLVALGSVPQTPSPYDTIPLFAIPRGLRETAVLVIGGNVALLFLVAGVGVRPEEVYPTYNRQVSLWALVFLYLPCLWFILRRPNETKDIQVPASTTAKSFRSRLVDLVLVGALLMSAFFGGWGTLAKYL